MLSNKSISRIIVLKKWNTDDADNYDEHGFISSRF